MEMKISDKTNVEVTAKISIFRTKNKVNEIVYVRNDKILGAKVGILKYFKVKSFLIHLLVGLLGGYAHYMYDTQFLGYEPNPGIISGIIFLFVIIGFFTGFKKKKLLTLVVEADETSLNKESYFSFEIGKETTDKNIEDLMYLLVN